MSTPVSMIAMTVPSPFCATRSVRIMTWELRLSGSWLAILDVRTPPAASAPTVSRTRVSRSMNAAATPGTARMASSDPAGALSATPCRAWWYSRSTWSEASGKAAVTASFTEARVASRSAPASRRTTMPVTRFGSCSLPARTGSASALSPFFEVSAVSASPTGRVEAVAARAVSAGEAAGWEASIGEASDEGLATASAHAPTHARRTADFFIDMVHSYAFVRGRLIAQRHWTMSATTFTISQEHA